MRNLADALVYSIVYLDVRADEDETHLDEYLSAVEKVRGILVGCSDRERRAMEAAVERAIHRELDADRPRKEYLERYRRLISDLFHGA